MAVLVDRHYVFFCTKFEVLYCVVLRKLLDVNKGYELDKLQP